MKKPSMLRRLLFPAAWILTLLLLIALVTVRFPHKHSPDEYKQIVLQYAEEYQVPTEIVFAVIEVESGFDERAVSSQGAKGLMQLMPATYRDICSRIGITPDEQAIFDPAVNIQCGTYYLAYLYEMFGNWDTVFAAYNAGLGNVSAWLESKEYADGQGGLAKIPFPETARYVQLVKKAIKVYRHS